MTKKTSKEKGVTGVQISYGSIARPYMPTTILGMDYNADITVDNIDKMLKGDGQVGGITNAINLAIQQTDWEMAPYKARGREKPEKRDIEIAEFVEKILTPLWPPFLSQVVDFLWYGFMPFEPIYKPEDGMIVWDRFAPRLPWTVQKWKSKDGHVAEMVQYAYDNDKEQYDSFTIPGTSLLRFTHKQRGENFEGESLLRSAWKHAQMKDLLYKVAIIGFEKTHVPTVIGALPDSATPEQEEHYEKILSNYRSNEVGYIYLGKIAEQIELDRMLKLLVPERSGEGPSELMELVRHHDILIARCALAQFLNLGETEFGSRQVSSDQVNLFLMNLEAITGYISNIVSRGNRGENEGIKTLVDLNFKNVAGYPTWHCGRIKKTDTAALMAVVAQLVQSTAMSPDENLETWIRKRLGIPLEKVQRTEPKEREKPSESKAKEKLNEPKKLQEARPLFEWEKHIAFEEIEETLDTASDEFVTAWRDVLSQQLEIIGRELSPSVTRKDLSHLNRLTMPLQGTLANRFESILARMFRRGQLMVRDELLRQVPTGLQEEERDEWLDEEEAAALIAARAEASATRLSDKTKDAIVYTALVGLAATAVIPWRDIERGVLGMSDGDARREAASTNLAYGLGRRDAEAHYAGLVEDQYYSAVLDRCTCDECARLDGVRYSEEPFVTPNVNCAGGSRCRCITVSILREGVTAGDIY